MQLKEFVSQTIIQLSEAILDAQEHLKDEWVRINPKPPEGTEASGPMLYRADNGAAVFPLAFDIAVSAEDVEGGGSFGIKVLNIGVDTKSDARSSTSNVTRVSFTIPIAYPLKKVGNTPT